MREGGSTTLDDLGEKRQGTEQRAGVGSKVSATLFLRVLPSSTAPHSLSFAFLESFGSPLLSQHAVTTVRVAYAPQAQPSRRRGGVSSPQGLSVASPTRREH